MASKLAHFLDEPGSTFIVFSEYSHPNWNFFNNLEWKNMVQCTVVGKVEINYFLILDFMASGQTLEDIWRLQGQNCEKLYL